MRIRLALLAVAAWLAVAGLGAQSASATPGSFAPTGSMTISRARASAAPLPNGRALVAGGVQECFCGPYSSDLDSAEIFNAGRFSSTGSMSVPRNGPVAAPLLDGRVLVAGGFNFVRFPQGASTTWRSAEIFDPATGSFSPTGSMSVPRGNAAAAPLPDGRVLVAGGSNFDDPGAGLRSAEIFDPATGSFSMTGSMSVARDGAAAAPLPGGRVLVAGGVNDLAHGSGLRSAEIFDPATGSFSPTGSMSVPHDAPAVAPLPDGRVLVDTDEIFDPVSGTFAPTGAMMTVGRFRPAAASLADGRVLIAGGDGQWPGSHLSGSLDSAELFTPGLSFQLRRRKLTAAVAVAGTFAVADVRNRRRWLKSTTTSGPGPITTKLRLTTKAKRKLQRKGKLRVGARLSFAPTPVRGECVTLTGPCYSSGYAISETATLMLRTKKRR